MPKERFEVREFVESGCAALQSAALIHDTQKHEGRPCVFWRLRLLSVVAQQLNTAVLLHAAANPVQGVSRRRSPLVTRCNVKVPEPPEPEMARQDEACEEAG